MALKIFLALGCNGKVDGNFVSCPKIENNILELSMSLEQINEIVQYFKALSLFSQTMKDYNAVRRVLFTIKDKYYQGCKPIWDDKFFRILEKFTLNHKECGIYLKIISVEENSNKM